MESGFSVPQSGPVPDFSRGNPDPVILECPACGASEAADPALLAGAPTIVCRNCGEAWPAANPSSEPAQEERAPPSQPETLHAERRPLVTYSGGPDRAWAAKIAGDILPEEARRSPSRGPISLAAIGAALFIGLFFGGREAAVSALPDLAGLYAGLGIPVNLDGLAIESVVAERTTAGDDDRLTVRGRIRNVGQAAQPVPPLTASLYDGAMAPAGFRGFDPPARDIAVGEARPFLLELDGVPRQATQIVLRFRRPAEHLPPAHEVAADAR